VPVLTATGTNVDWVLLELRSAGSPGLRVASRAAPIAGWGRGRRVSGLINAANGNYVAPQPQAVTASPASLSFSPASISYLPATNTTARKNVVDNCLVRCDFQRNCELYRQ
jgi:hypothetical protein